MASRSRPTAGLDWIVGGARADAPLAERLEWLEHLADWVTARVRDGGRVAVAGADAPVLPSGATPAVRLRFLLQVLSRQGDRRAEVARLLRRTFAELDATTLLCQAGLPRANAFFQELFSRLANKVLPPPPLQPDMATLFARFFTRPHDAGWIATLPDDVLDGIAALLHAPADEAGSAAGDPLVALRRAGGDAMLVLASEVQAIGLSERVRRHGGADRLRDSPFAALATEVKAFIAADAPADPQALALRVAACREALARAMRYLEESATSTDLVYTLERARLSLSRIERLAGIPHATRLSPRAAARFAAGLVEASVDQRSVRSLLRLTGRMLARRVVESARRTGEHYITRDAAEYRAMLRSAAIGGALTGVTVLIKIATIGHGLPLFLEGLVASLNYAVSFVAIHLLHGTLATKQPAMTAAAMAAKLNVARHRGRLREFTDEVANLVRSQTAAIAGNLLLVAPAALLIWGVLLAATGVSLPDPDHAPDYVASLSVLGPTPLYAVYTGVLLWLSAVIAGWFENWAAYRRLPEAIAASPVLERWLGPLRAARVARGIEDNVAALGGNVSLGLLLGMTPVIAAFFGVPLEVRHVTLSTGQLAVAAAASGPGIFRESAFWLAVAGIGVIGFLNLTVSFLLALGVALRSTDVSAPTRRRVRRAIVARLLRRPRDFLLPPRARDAERATPVRTG